MRVNVKTRPQNVVGIEFVALGVGPTARHIIEGIVYGLSSAFT